MVVVSVSSLPHTCSPLLQHHGHQQDHSIHHRLPLLLQLRHLEKVVLPPEHKAVAEVALFVSAEVCQVRPPLIDLRQLHYGALDARFGDGLRRATIHMPLIQKDAQHVDAEFLRSNHSAHIAVFDQTRDEAAEGEREGRHQTVIALKVFGIHTEAQVQEGVNAFAQVGRDEEMGDGAA